MPLRNLWNPRAGRLTTRPSPGLDAGSLDIEASFFLVGAMAVNVECSSDLVVEVRWEKLRVEKCGMLGK
jgi:hypothetical protein